MASLRFLALIIASAGVVAACATAGPSQPNQNTNDAPTGNDASLEVDANNCATQPCDILTQCGCASNAACDVDGSDLNGTACRLVSGSAVGEGGSCAAGPTACAGGTVCLGNSPSVCKKYCDGDDDCGQPRGKCVIEITDGTNVIPGVPKVCSANCDPVNPGAGGCPAGARCGLFTQNVGGTQVPIVDCDNATANGGGQGVVCGNTTMGNDSMCNANHLCTQVGAGTNFTCRRICVVGGAGICSAGQTCLTFNPPATVAGTTYGVCN